MSINAREVLKASIPFSSLDEDILSELAAHVEVKTYPQGTYVFKQGQNSLQVLFLIATGLGEVTLTGDRGQETIVSYRHQYEFFGETALFTDHSFSL